MNRLVPSRLGSIAPVAALGVVTFCRAGALPEESKASARGGAEAEAGSAGEEGAKGGDTGARPLFFLRDGSKVSGSPITQALQITTRYGTLTVPTGELLRVEFARRIPPKLQSEIQDEIERLGSDDFDEREAATERLRALGERALLILRKSRDTENEEARSRIESLLAEIDTGEPDAAEDEEGEDGMGPSPGESDVVVTRRFTIRGRVDAASFSVQSRFGVLEIPIDDINGIDYRHGTTVSGTFTVPASKTPPQNWLNTKLSVSKGERLSIRAAGELYLSNYNIRCGAGGWGRTGTFHNFPALSLVGKFGRNGEPFLVGASWRQKVRRSGTLYLAVVPYRRYVATGSFRVRVQSIR